MKRIRDGFTLIELLFVIVIMGIVGGFALEAVRQYYEGIYRTQVYTQRVAEADHILDLLSKYFENAVDLSIVNMDEDAADNALVGNCEGDPEEEAENIAHDYTVVFVGVDTDSLRTIPQPGWSEIAKNTPPFDGNTITFDDANLSLADTTIQALYPASNLENSAIYNHQSIADTCDDFYSSNGNAYYTINGSLTGNTLPLLNNAGTTTNIEARRKYLLRTGYAFRVLDTGEFVMFSNFRPWKGENYTTGNQNRLGDNVASFYADFNNTNSYSERGSVWRLKVCMRGLDGNLTTNDLAQDAICRERKVHVHY
ncbi:type II secretion system protein [Sulfuricurvum sp.]|uniref:type II secretion system protein n=1 Tax=Sulfuricurvum sp. TaxID=2025608 RepID=UPI002606D02C|nr:type II secretion system protein [Sulfuricurvum sp.]MDD2781752.1 type II secretion system protein [Sulfuricurvum sp.]